MTNETTQKLGRAAWEAVHDHGAFRRDFPDDEYYEAVGAAVLAVFEKAHAKELDTSPERVKNGADSLRVAPTDDDREAWANWSEQSEPGSDWESFRAGFRAGFRRTAVPTDDERDRLTLIARDVHLYDGGETAAITGPHARRIADAILATLRRAEVPEPSDEDLGPAASCHLCVGAGGYEDHDGVWVACSCQRGQFPEPQGEPSGHDRDDMGICRQCGRGVTARDLLDGEKPCAASSTDTRDALIEGAKLDARNSMRSDPRVWHEALEAALDKVLPPFWDAALRAAYETKGEGR